jgi:hypothetical protein
MHNPGSMGTWLEFDRVINSGPVCSCGPVLDAVPSMDRSRGTYLQFPRVISAEPVGSCDPLRAGWQFDRVINAGPVLDAVPSIDQRRPGQQLRFPREGTRCTTLDPMAGSMHNPGSNGRKYAQSRIPGPAVCTTLDSRPAVCRRLHTFGERLQTKASSMQTSAYIWRTSANQGQQYANVCKHSENVCKPRPAAAIPCGPVGSCDPWGLGWSSIE